MRCACFAVISVRFKNRERLGTSQSISQSNSLMVRCAIFFLLGQTGFPPTINDSQKSLAKFLTSNRRSLESWVPRTFWQIAELTQYLTECTAQIGMSLSGWTFRNCPQFGFLTARSRGSTAQFILFRVRGGVVLDFHCADACESALQSNSCPGPHAEIIRDSNTDLHKIG